MMSNPRTFNRRLTAVVAALGLVAAACGGDEASTSTTAPAVTDAAPAATDGAPDETGEPFRIAIVAPSAANDISFTQAMIDSVDRLRETRDIEVDVTDGTFVVEDAAAAIRGYANAGYDLVIAHGSQFGAPVSEIAPDFPDVAFAWGTAAGTFDLPNVSSYSVRGDQGGYVMGTIAAQITETDVVGIVGAVEVGDVKFFNEGFANGVRAQDPDVQVPINYIDSYSDVALAAEAASAMVANGADVLTGSSQMVIGAIGVARDAGNVRWFGTDANQSSLAPDNVVASQVMHWEVVLTDLIERIESGTLGGEMYEISLANQGIVIEYNDQYPLDPEVRAAADAVVAGIIDGSIDTGVE